MFIYAMKNASMPGLYKIGVSENPSKRVVELSSPSGVPTRFEIVVQVWCSYAAQASRAERIAHLMLEPSRVNTGREFFELEHENEAIQAVHIAALAAGRWAVPGEVEEIMAVVANHPCGAELASYGGTPTLHSISTNQQTSLRGAI